MKYKPKQYAEALVATLESADVETARVRIRTFIMLLHRHQMLGKAGIIAHIAERLLAKRTGARRVTFEIASAVSDAIRREFVNLFDGKVWMEEKVRPELLAGIRILIDDETLVDATGARRLAQMFYHAA